MRSFVKKKELHFEKRCVTSDLIENTIEKRRLRWVKRCAMIQLVGIICGSIHGILLLGKLLIDFLSKKGDLILAYVLHSAHYSLLIISVFVLIYVILILFVMNSKNKH